MPVQQLRVRRQIGGPHLLRRRHGRRADGGASQRHANDDTPDAHTAHTAHAAHQRTTTAAFGDRPNISGLYIASTRVGGRLNWPALFRRTVYSTLHFPFGTNWK